MDGEDTLIRRVAYAGAIVALLAHATVANAQDVHVYGALGVDLWLFGVHSLDQGSPGFHYDNIADNARVPGATSELGLLVGNVAVGVEVDLPIARAAVTQRHYYFNPFTRLARYQEWRVLGVAHFYVPRGDVVRVGLVTGGGRVFSSSLDRFSYCRYLEPSTCEPFTPEQEATRAVITGFVGGEAVVRVNRHLNLVPQFRVEWTGRGDVQSAGSEYLMVALGVDSVSYWPSLSLRVTF